MRMVTAAVAVTLLAVAGCSADDGQPESAGSSAPPAASGSPVGKPNGVETLPPEEVLKRAREAARQARSVHLVATSETANLDMELTQDASDGSRSSGAKSIETRVVDDTLYIKAEPAYWQEAFPRAKVARIGDRWVAADLSNPKLKSWRQTTTFDPLIKTFLSGRGASSVGEPGVQQGQPAVPVTTAIGTVWVATTGRPYALAINSASGDVVSDAQFTDWDADIRIEAPPAGQTVDIMELS